MCEEEGVLSLVPWIHPYWINRFPLLEHSHGRDFQLIFGFESEILVPGHCTFTMKARRLELGNVSSIDIRCPPPSRMCDGGDTVLFPVIGLVDIVTTLLDRDTV